VILGGVHHIEGGEVDAADGAAPATDAAMRLREEEPEIIGVDAETRIQGAKGRAKTLPFVLCRVLAGAVATAYLDRTQVPAR
jgi:hypothetical protein